MELCPYEPGSLARTLFEDSPDAIFLFDVHTLRIAEVNPASLRMTQYPRDKMLQMKVGHLLRTEPAHYARLVSAFASNDCFHGSDGFFLRHRLNDLIPVEVTMKRVRDQGECHGLLIARDLREQRYVEERLARKESQLRRVFESIADCVWSDEVNEGGNWRSRYCSPAIERLTGRPASFFMESVENFYQIVYPPDRDALRQSDLDFVSRREPTAIEFRIVLPDGTLRWVRDSMRARYDERHRLHIDGVLSDITEQKLLSAQASASKQQLEDNWSLLHNLFQATPVGLALYDCECRYVQINACLASINGATVSDHIGMTPHDILPASLADITTDRIRQVLAIGQAIHEQEVVSAAPSQPEQLRIWQVSYIPHRDRNGAIHGVYLTLIDVTEHRQIAERLRKSEGQYRNLVETSNDLIWSIDTRGRWTYVNRQALKAIVGYEPEEVLGRRLGEFMPPELVERDTQIALSTLTGKSLHRHETVLVRKDGVRVSVSVNAIPQFDEQGQPIGLTGTATDITRFKEAEAALIESRQIFESFMNTIPLVGFIKDAEGKLVYVNQEYLKRFQRPAASLLGTRNHERWPAEVAEQLRQADVRVIAGAAPVELREHVPTPDGVMREWWVAKFPFRDHQNRVFLGGVALDLTERRQMEEALRRSEERYRLLWQRNLAGVFRTSIDGEILDCNSAFAQLFGYDTRSEMLRHSTLELYFHPTVRAEFIRRLRESKYLANFETEMRRADGAAVYVLENVSLLVENGRELLEGTIIDITERRRAEVALRISENNYRTLVNHLDQAIFLKDSQLRYITGNPVLCAGMGMTEDQIRGRTIGDLYPDHLIAKTHEIERRVIEEGRSIVTEDVMKIGSRQRTIRVTRTPIKDENGVVIGLLGIAWDVTDQRMMETQLRHVDKMNAVGQLAGGIAHDFNNLLTIMLGNLSFALSSSSDLETVRDLVRNAEQAGLRAAELTKTLLGFARQSTVATLAINLNRAIDEVLTITRASLPADIYCETNLRVDLWPVQADPTQINQVLTNLTLNARDAMPAGGQIVFETSHFTPNQDYLGLQIEARAGDFVRLSVRDSGLGIAPDVLPRIFEPFFTTKPKDKGTGLGLAMVFSIVKQHLGWIECFSEPGQGTRFDVFLPRWRGDAPATNAASQERVKHYGQALILVVDDEALIRKLAKTILTQVGYDVLLAENGAIALELYRAHRDRIALVILDAVMPVLSGRDTLKELIRLNPSVEVLFSSGFATETLDLNEFRHVRGFLPKPYRAEQLVQKVSEILRRVHIAD